MIRIKNLSKPRFGSRLINDERGAAALMGVVILTAFVVLVVGTVAFTGLNGLEIGNGGFVSDGTLVSAESCLDETLLRLTRNHAYSGGSLTVGNVACNATVTGTPCGDCQVNVVATRAPYTRRVRSHIFMTGSKIDIIDWAEMP